MKPKTDTSGITAVKLSQADLAVLKRALDIIRPIYGENTYNAFCSLSSLIVTHGPIKKPDELTDKERTTLADAIDRLLCFMICEGKETSAADDAKIAVSGLRDVLNPPKDDE